jgi:hypothetical protein
MVMAWMQGIAIGALTPSMAIGTAAVMAPLNSECVCGYGWVGRGGVASSHYTCLVLSCARQSCGENGTVLTTACISLPFTRSFRLLLRIYCYSWRQ